MSIKSCCDSLPFFKTNYNDAVSSYSSMTSLYNGLRYKRLSESTKRPTKVKVSWPTFVQSVIETYSVNLIWWEYEKDGNKTKLKNY